MNGVEWQPQHRARNADAEGGQAVVPCPLDRSEMSSQRRWRIDPAGTQMPVRVENSLRIDHHHGLKNSNRFRREPAQRRVFKSKQAIQNHRTGHLPLGAAGEKRGADCDRRNLFHATALVRLRKTSSRSGSRVETSTMSYPAARTRLITWPAFSLSLL